MATRHEKITKRLIDGLSPAPGEDLFIMDTELPGFGYRLKPSGSAAYFVKYVTWDGPKRRDARHKVADKRAAPEEARKQAKILLSQVALGADPSAKRKEERQALLVHEVCTQYMEAAKAGLVLTRFGKPKKGSTLAIDEGRIERHIKPLIGDMVADKVSRADIQRMADAISAGKTAGQHKTKARGLARVTGGAGTAARVVELLGGIWTWAERRGLVGNGNPARGVERYRGEPRDRVLSPPELARLGAVLREHEETKPAAVTAIRLLALTGARMDEICGMEWDEVDIPNSCLRLKVTKTGRSTRPVAGAVLAVLKRTPRVAEYVFPASKGDGPADLKKPIASLFDAAGIFDARAQALRSTFMSIGDAEGYSEPTIKELVGHARRGVTQRHYIRRPDAALIAAADRVAARIIMAMDGEQSATIIPIKNAADQI